MTGNLLEVPNEYTDALSERLGFDLSPGSLATRNGKSYIARMAGIVSQINKGLTTDRAEFLSSKYLREKEIRDAYALYYMTTNLLKIYQPLHELSFSRLFDREGMFRILDLGTGTGSAAWGALSYLLRDSGLLRTELLLTDSLQENIAEAEQFSRHFLSRLSSKPKMNFEIFDLHNSEEIPVRIQSSAPFQLIIMMNVLNELDKSRDLHLLDSLFSLLDENGALILIEPATRTESRRLLRMRDIAVSQGSTVYSPCTRQAGCPALVDKDDWCHTDVPWNRPPFIKAIDDIVGTLRLSLKSTYMILRKDGLTLSRSLEKENLYRIVSERFDEKGRVRGILCGENGRYEHIINKRDLSESNNSFGHFRRYDLARMTGEVVREHDIKLLKDTKFTVVLPILGAR